MVGLVGTLREDILFYGVIAISSFFPLYLPLVIVYATIYFPFRKELVYYVSRGIIGLIYAFFAGYLTSFFISFFFAFLGSILIIIKKIILMISINGMNKLFFIFIFN